MLCVRGVRKHGALAGSCRPKQARARDAGAHACGGPAGRAGFSRKRPPIRHLPRRQKETRYTVGLRRRRRGSKGGGAGGVASLWRRCRPLGDGAAPSSPAHAHSSADSVAACQASRNRCIACCATSAPRGRARVRRTACDEAKKCGMREPARELAAPESISKATLLVTRGCCRDRGSEVSVCQSWHSHDPGELLIH